MPKPKNRRRFTSGWILAALLALVLGACGQPAAPRAGLEILSARATSQTSIDVTFSAPVGTGAADAANFDVRGPDGAPLEVLAAYPSGDARTVTLATEPQQLVTYVLAVRNVAAADSGHATTELTSQGGFGGSADSAPFVASAIALNNTQVLVTFAEPNSTTPADMSDSALNVAYYQIASPGLEILGAAFADGKDRARVILTTSSMADMDYSVRVTNVQSASGGKLVDPFLNTAGFRGITKDDAVAPTVRAVFATGNTTVVVQFSEPVAANATSPANYRIYDGDDVDVPVVSAVFNDVKTEVTLTTWPMTAGVTYTLEIDGVTDANLNPLPFTTMPFDGTPVDASEDYQSPRVLGATSTDNTTVVVTFSEPVADGMDSAANPDHYRIVDSASMEGGIGTQAIVVVKDAVLSANQRTVTLTTLSQSEVKYTLAVTNVKDLVGNQVEPPDRQHPYQTTFFGTGVSGVPSDSDGDGLSDAEEQYGWTVTVALADGGTATRNVTSDPGDSSLPVGHQVNLAAADTDGDDIPDRDEKIYLLDPRNEDTDDDGLTDFQELNHYYTEPAVQDSDGDGLNDGLEANFFLTSPLTDDTDGDQLDDAYEVVTDNRNPRSADLPVVGIDIGVVDLRLDVRFDEQTSTGTRTLDTKDVSTTLSQSQESAQSRETSSSLDWFVSLGAEVCIYGGCEEAKPGGAKFSAEGGVSGSTSTTFTTASVRATQREYATSLTTEAEVSAESVVNRVVEGATMAVEVNLANRSNIAFTISDIEITALLQDPRDPTVLVPVGTLFAASSSPISIGPLTPERGPFRFETDNAFPSLVESLMANPRGLVFRVANYDIVDEFGRNFAFVEQDVNDRTMFLEIDFAGNEPLERHQLATNATFDPAGQPTGITMAQLLEDILGLQYVSENDDGALNPENAADAELIDNSYSTRDIGGVDTLWRIRRVSRELTGQERDWWVIGPQGNITPVGSRPGQGFRDYVAFSDQDFIFAFVQDLDQDDLEAVEEAFYRSIDSEADTEAPLGEPDSRDSDRDGIDDADEVYGPYSGNRRIRWTIRPEDGTDAYQTMAHPGRVDTDGDGLTDCQELLIDAGCARITVYEDVDGVPTLAARSTSGTAHTLLGYSTLDAATDPGNPDTDHDGIPDAVEAIGFRYIDLDGAHVILTFSTQGGDPYATNPLNPDTDRDGLQDLHELRLGSNPRAEDGDSVLDDDADGLVNAIELNGWSVTSTNTSGVASTHTVTSDPNLEDTDGDGLTDWEEYWGCRDANRDRRCDTESRFGATHPDDTDTDNDVLTDRQEVDGVDFPSDTTQPFRVTHPRLADTDGDTRSDGAETGTPWLVEVAGRGGYLVWSDPLLADADGEGLDDNEERAIGTDPNNPDSDDDGALDDLESGRVTNPLVPDHLVTVTYLSLQAGTDVDTADGDGDEGLDPGDYFFSFGVRVPTASGGLAYRHITDSATVPADGCMTNDQSLCRNNAGGDHWIQLAAPHKFHMYESTTFSVPFTALFTVEGIVQELDPRDGVDYADISYDFGGVGATEGTYSGSDLTKGSFSIAFNQSPNPSVPIEVTVLVRVE